MAGSIGARSKGRRSIAGLVGARVAMPLNWRGYPQKILGWGRFLRLS